ncbi:MAG: GltB/FmdC/FwdC-like GXGXG domain-containing protein, partial [Streptosporangiaceae bacterium]
FIAEQVREYLARLGFRTLDEAVGRADMLSQVPAASGPGASGPGAGGPGAGGPGASGPGASGPGGRAKAAGLDLGALLHLPDLPAGAARHRTTSQADGLGAVLDRTLIQQAAGALAGDGPVRLDLPVRNTDRAVGTMLGAEVTRRWGGAGLPDDTIVIGLRGSAGQSLGAFLPRGVTIRLSGDANDYVGKGLSGGRVVVTPDPRSTFEAHHQVIAGNVIGYGATSGELFLRGVVGERFCVRNSGATAVAEGVGDHGCEYMTGGRAVVLGPTGRNFAAGMSGGIAYLLDPDPELINTEMVDTGPVQGADAEFLLDLLARYHEQTGSPVAAGLLADPDGALARFRRVLPRDYQRVLAASRRARQDGHDVAEAVMAAARG